MQTFKKYFKTKFNNTIEGEYYILASSDDIEYYQDIGVLWYTGDDIMLRINNIFYYIEIEEVKL